MERAPRDIRVNEIIWWFIHVINDQIDTILFDWINDKHFIDNAIMTVNILLIDDSKAMYNGILFWVRNKLLNEERMGWFLLI